MDTNTIAENVMDVTEEIVTNDTVATSGKGKGVIGLIVGVAIGIAVPKILAMRKAKKLAKLEARENVDNDPEIVEESSEDLGV
jgi:hypothetical protein